MDTLTGVLPVPPHFDPEAVGTVRRVEYERIAADARAWAATYRIPPARDDAFRVCLLLVDLQITFCIPGFALYVGGRSGRAAVDDNRRLCRFIYRNLPRLTRIVATMDTHRAAQIFHSLSLVDARGVHPPPFTVVTVADVEAGRWRFNRVLGDALGFPPDYGQQHLLHYVRQLAATGKYALTVWPYHALLGGVGHALAPAVEEAVFFHTVARYSPPEILLKGTHPLTEHYSALGPEVNTGPEGAPLVTPDPTLAHTLVDYDAVVVAGQAKSHCVAWTVADLLRTNPAKARKVYLLDDATSPIVAPGGMDFTEAAETAFAGFAEAGAHVVRTTEPMEEWPGMAALRSGRPDPG